MVRREESTGILTIKRAFVCSWLSRPSEECFNVEACGGMIEHVGLRKGTSYIQKSTFPKLVLTLQTRIGHHDETVEQSSVLSTARRTGNRRVWIGSLGSYSDQIYLLVNVFDAALWHKSGAHGHLALPPSQKLG